MTATLFFQSRAKPAQDLTLFERNQTQERDAAGLVAQRLVSGGRMLRPREVSSHNNPPEFSSPSTKQRYCRKEIANLVLQRVDWQ